MPFFVLCTQLLIDHLKVLSVVTETAKKNAVYKHNATTYWLKILQGSHT